jgi:dihydroorotase
VEFCNAANGISGLETALSLSYTHLVKAGHIALSRLAQLMSAAPARILGLEPRELRDGRRADIALVDFESSFVIDSSQFLSKGKNTPFNGQKVYGAVACTINEGRIVYQDIMRQGR